MKDILSFGREHGLVSQEPQADPTLSAIPSSQDDRGLDIQKYIDKYLADGVPKEKIADDLKENNNYIDLEGIFNNQKTIADLYGKLAKNRPLEEMSDSGIINLNADNFAMYKSRIREDLQKGFGFYALKDLEIAATGKRPNTRYGIGMEKGRAEKVAAVD
jgi:hypothetical protein